MLILNRPMNINHRNCAVYTEINLTKITHRFLNPAVNAFKYIISKFETVKKSIFIKKFTFKKYEENPKTVEYYDQEKNYKSYSFMVVSRQ